MPIPPSRRRGLACHLFYGAAGLAGYGALAAAFDIGFLGTLAFAVVFMLALGMAIREDE